VRELIISNYIYYYRFTREVTEEGLARTNLIYGGRTPDVTRVVYSHGSLDPWHPYGILQDLGPDAPVVMMNGGVLQLVDM
jgi:hypothetical protein